MAKHYSKDERAELIGKIEALRTKGLTLEKACKEMGVHHTTFYGWKGALGRNKAKVGRPKKKRAEPALLTMPIPASAPETTRTDGRLIALIGTASDVEAALLSIFRNQG